jgi:hypothetical protein
MDHLLNGLQTVEGSGSELSGAFLNKKLTIFDQTSTENDAKYLKKIHKLVQGANGEIKNPNHLYHSSAASEEVNDGQGGP